MYIVVVWVIHRAHSGKYINRELLDVWEGYHFLHGERCSHISHGVETGFIRCRFLRLE